MLFDEPMATQGFRTTGNDPLNQFASWYQFGQNLRQGADARRARKEAQEMARAEAQKYGNSNPQQGAIGADANGVYGVNSTPAQPPVGIGADASGMYGVNGTPQQSKYTFNESDYIPSEGNGYHLGDYKQTEMYGNPTDFQRQMASNAIGYNLGSFEPRQQTWFPKDGNGTNPDNSMNITSQKIGQNYNGRIDGQVGGLNIPQSPQQNSFGSAINNAQNPLNSFTGGSVLNFLNPVASGDSAQVAGGATNLSADNPFARSSRYLGADYDKMAYVKSALDNGVKNPLVAMAMYDQMIEPLRQSAREDELRNAFFVLQSPESSAQDKMNAISLIQYYKKDPYMAENQQMRRDKAMYEMGYLPEGDFGYGDNDGGEYGGDDANAGAIYSHLASKGVPANVIAGIMGNLQAESGFNSSAVGDNGQSIGLAQWYDSRGNNLRNFAQQRGKDWTDIPTQVDFLLSEIQQSNPDLLQRMSKLSPHDAAILFHDEFERSADSPEMKARRGQFAEGIYGNRRQSMNRRYRRDPYRVSPREQFNYNQQRDATNYALRNRAIDARLAAKTGNVNGNFEKNNVGVREAAMNLAGLQDISPDDEKGIQNYEKGMKDFTKQIGALYDAYGLNGNKMDSTQLGIALYHKLNETRSGLRPETLAEGVARAIYLKRGDVGAEDLQRAILAEVYRNNGQQGGTQTESNSKNGRKDPVDDLNYEDRRSGGYNIDGVSMSEEMYNNIKSIKPYEKTVKDSKERFAAEAEAAENRRRANEEERIRLYDELEKNFGI